MGFINDALAIGLQSLSLGGNTVTFRGESLQIPPINFAPDTRARKAYNFTENVKSIAWLPVTTAPAPAAELADYFTDETGRIHRIVAVQFNGVAYVCGCTVSKT